MTGRGTGCVVVGIDPGWRSDDVVLAAAEEAERRGVQLAIVAVARHSQDTRHSAEALKADDDWTASVARRALADAYDRLGVLTARVPTTTACLWKDEVVPALEPLSRAELLVVGTRGRHGRRAFGLTSVSRTLLKAVRCPVLAVPPGHNVPAPGARAVLVGVGDHPWDRAVLGTALREAQHRGCGIHLLHAYVPRFDETLTRGLQRAQELVTAVTEGLDPGAGTSVSVLLTQDSPAAALLEQARHASLVVVGSRPGALSGLVLESVSRAVLEDAPCPVLVVLRGEPVTDPAGEPVGVVREEDAAAELRR